MTWLFIALIPPALFSIVNFIDKYLVSGRYGEQPLRMLMGFNVLAQAAGVVILLFTIGTTVLATTFSTTAFWLAFLSGALFVCYIPLYYRAMMHSSTSIVTPFFQLIPLFALGLGVLFLGEVPTLLQMVGIGLIVAGATGLSLEGGNFRAVNVRLVGFMLVAALLIAVSLVMFKMAAEPISYSAALIASAFGGFGATACIWILLPKTKTLRDLPSRHRLEFAGWELLNEFLDRGAEWALRYAATIGPVALVQAVNGIQPLIVLVYGAILALVFPSVFAHERASWTPRVIVSIVVLVVGAVLVTFQAVE